jgi:hypothetical protein
LEDVEEILHLQNAVIGEVGTVHSILSLITTEYSSQRFGTNCSSHFWIVGAAKLSQSGDDVLLTNFEGDTGSVCQFLYNLIVFWDDSLINF